MVKRKHALAEEQEDRNSSLLSDPLQHLTELPSLLQNAADGSDEVHTLFRCAQDLSGQDGCICQQCLQEEQLTALHQLKLFFLGAAREGLLYKVHAAAQAAAAETLKSLTHSCLQEAGSKETASTAQAWLRKRYSRYVDLLSQLLTQGASTSLQVGALPALPAWPYRQSKCMMRRSVLWCLVTLTSLHSLLPGGSTAEWHGSSAQQADRNL